MRAVVYDRYGPPEVQRLADVAQPVPRADEALIKIHATTVNRTDCAVRGGGDVVTRLGYSYFTTGSPFKALMRPQQRILGMELAGDVVAVGAAVTEFAVGDAVFGVNPGGYGAHAEYVCMRQDAALARKPAGMPYDEAAAVCDGAILALEPLDRTHAHEGQRILIYGAGGSIGTAAVQLARYFGAHVTAVCSTKNLDLVRSLGADHVIDRAQQDFTRNGETYDIILDAVGKHSFERCKGSLTPGGVYLPTDGWENVPLSLWTSQIGDKRVVLSIPPHYTKQRVEFLKKLIEAGNYRAVIDRRYPLEQVIEATRYVEMQYKTGNVVLTVSGE